MSEAKIKVKSFLQSIGISVTQGKVPRTSFLPNVIIKNGCLIYDDKIEVSDLLHEAGHVAIVPAKYRAICNGDMDKSMLRVWAKAERAGETKFDSPIYWQLIQASECEAIAWAWAVGKHLGLLEAEIIPDHHYDMTGVVQRAKLAAKQHFGINGLRASGMIESVKKYPHLTRWTQL